MPVKWLLILVALGGLAVPRLVRADPVEVIVDAEASSKEAAVSKALVDALQQVTGVAIAATQQTSTALAAVAHEDGTAAAQLSEESQAELTRQTNGVIKSYRILDVQPTTGQSVMVHLSVVIEKYTPKGLGTESRRRLAVAAFTDPTGKPIVRGTHFQELLTGYLVQTRRFAVVDRNNDTAYIDEMSLIAGGNANAADRARLGQVLGADYVVVGHLEAATSHTTETPIAITGEITRNTTTTAGRVEYSVIEIATRQVKWSGTIATTGTDDSAAARVGDDILEAIYPLRVIDASDPQELVINQGGSSIRPGSRFRVFALSAEMFDPYSKESLGRREREVGTVEITHVLPKMSYAKLETGKLPDNTADLILRRVTGATGKPARPAGGKAIAPANDGALKLPFD